MCAVLLDFNTHTDHVWFWLRCRFLLSRLSWGYVSHKLPSGADMSFLKPIQQSEDERKQIQVFLTPGTALHWKSVKVWNRKGKGKPNTLVKLNFQLCFLFGRWNMFALKICQNHHSSFLLIPAPYKCPILIFYIHTGKFSHFISKIYVLWLFIPNNFFRRILETGSVWLSWWHCWITPNTILHLMMFSCKSEIII